MITVIGANTIDYFSYSKRLPKPGETMVGDEMMIGPGGKGANQAVAAAKLGAPVCWLSKVGELDRYKDMVLDGVKAVNIDISAVEEVKGIFCGAGYVMINSETGQNSIIILHGANAEITPAYIDAHKDKILGAKICMAEFQVPVATAKYALTMAKKNGVMTICNPAPAAPIDEDFFPMIDVITPNEVEARDITGITVDDEASAAQAAAFFHGKGIKNVVITLGSRGAFVSVEGNGKLIPNYTVKAIDTSGAGDCFNGALAYALHEGADLFAAAEYANAAAAVSVCRKGTMDSMPTREDVEAFLQANKK